MKSLTGQLLLLLSHFLSTQMCLQMNSLVDLAYLAGSAGLPLLPHFFTEGALKDLSLEEQNCFTGQEYSGCRYISGRSFKEQQLIFIDTLSTCHLLYMN